MIHVAKYIEDAYQHTGMRSSRAEGVVLGHVNLAGAPGDHRKHASRCCVAAAALVLLASSCRLGKEKRKKRFKVNLASLAILVAKKYIYI